jgi:hypothetical protein
MSITDDRGVLDSKRSLSLEDEHDENTGSPLGWSTLACPTVPFRAVE